MSKVQFCATMVEIGVSRYGFFHSATVYSISATLTHGITVKSGNRKSQIWPDNSYSTAGPGMLNNCPVPHRFRETFRLIPLLTHLGSCWTRPFTQQDIGARCNNGNCGAVGQRYCMEDEDIFIYRDQKKREAPLGQ
jgi:hypothetical protein